MRYKISKNPDRHGYNFLLDIGLLSGYKIYISSLPPTEGNLFSLRMKNLKRACKNYGRTAMEKWDGV